ncbi:MAG: sulfatase-like hydrolase/transferase [Williamsia sp.]|nr:sulfatase-like hydrolase/transferase [Williamsia sp.]
MAMQINKLVYLVLAALLLCKAGAAQKRSAAQRPPNIIFILTDDMGYGDISCFNGGYKTPHVDQLAREGRKFTHYYSPSPICSPSRTGFLTGMSPAKWNITSFLQKRAQNRQCEQADYLTLKAPSIARILHANGYATGHFGKWHMGGGRDVKDAPSIHAYGFDEYNSTWESPDPDPLITATDWIWSDKDSIKRWQRTGYFVDKTLAFLAKHKEQPCFINLWPDDVHTPWVPGDERTGKYPADRESEINFRAVLEEYDRQIGRLLEGIEKLGIEKNTLIVFTSDNGPLPSFKGSRSAGLRGSKLSLYEGGTRMPFIAWWPGQIKAGTTDSASVLCGTDLLPTFCKLAGVALPQTVQPDGEDRTAVLLGAPAARKKPIFWEYGRNDSTFNYPQGRDRSPNIALREGRWKLLMNASGTNQQLYDLETDPNESTNVIELHAQLASAMEKKLLAWRRSLPPLSSWNKNSMAKQ